MSDDDKKLFPADSEDFVWSKFHLPYYAGLREYVLEDPLESWAKSKKWTQTLRTIHYTLKTITFVIIAMLFYFYVLKRLFISHRM